MAKKKQGLSSAQKVGIGVGLTAAAVTAAGTYFLYGSKNAAKNRKKVKSWALKAKGEILEVLEKAEHITEEEYHALVDKVGDAYGKARKLSANEVKDFKREMRSNWNGIVKSGKSYVATAAKTAKKKSKKSAKKATKKTAKKTSKKSVKKATKKGK